MRHIVFGRVIIPFIEIRNAKEAENILALLPDFQQRKTLFECLKYLEDRLYSSGVHKIDVANFPHLKSFTCSSKRFLFSVAQSWIDFNIWHIDLIYVIISLFNSFATNQLNVQVVYVYQFLQTFFL